MSPRNKRPMHSRNIFRTPPDYTTLAIKYKEFRKVCKLELTGKVCIDYRNESALRALTQTLLLEYFQLQLEIAPGSLVPTLPLRLNYILWVEDLVKLLEHVTPTLHGIDIGCGSSCIYSLLAARKNSWHMLALESNALNLQYAHENVQRNALQENVHIFEQKNPKVIFANYFDSLPADAAATEQFQFCLCNPPFYDSQLPSQAANTTRNVAKRPRPHNCPTGQTEELACAGGEVAFVQQIVAESLLYPARVSIFTSMLGLKTSVAKICDFLQSNQITNFTTTEFCQGNTTRWGIAWSFSDKFALNECS